jgi:CRISPR/Cas system-associated exonuclease Cas4 (RecB family)
LRIPLEKKTLFVDLTEDLEREVEERIVISNPPKPVKIQYCKRCAYKGIYIFSGVGGLKGKIIPYRYT